MKVKLIELTEPHTHAGVEYAAGAVLQMDEGSADWLIGLKRAKDAGPKAKPVNA